jgi:HPt (histidine-containing phosphotransfer) domain-containing protein
MRHTVFGLRVMSDSLPSMVMEEPLLDNAALDRLRGFGGEKLLSGMIELFVKNAPTKAADAREALDCGDAAALRAAVHALKSSSGQLGAVTVHQACVAGEELASRGELNACVEHVKRIESDLPVACRMLGAILLSD